MRLRVGLIGLGESWDARYGPALVTLADRFDVRVVYSHVGLLAEKAARRFDASTCSGFRAITQRHDIDAILILACDWQGVLPILAACSAGKAVYCAADVDVNREQADAIKAAAERSGVAYVAEFPRRHAPATLRLKELIATRLGAPQLIFCHERLETSGRTPNVSQTEQRQSIWRKMVNLVDWCCYLVGQSPSSVVSVAHHTSGESPQNDYQMLSLQFPSASPTGHASVAQVSCGSYISSRWPEAVSFRPPSQLQLSCERGIAFVDLPSTVIWFDDAGRHLESLDGERPIGEQLLMHFHRSVTSLIRKTSDLEDADRALRIVLAAKEGFKTGRRMDFSW